MRLRLIVNPVASSMTERRRRLVEAALGAGHSLETVATTGRGQARELAREAAGAGVDVVVVAAGDGTLNEAAGGLIGTNTALGPLPGGSTNVFARAIGYGNHLERAAGRLLRALDQRTIQRVGIGVANRRQFLFHLGAGFDAAVVARMEQVSPRVKRYAAHPAFAVATVRTFHHGYDRTHPTMRVRLPDGDQHESYFTVVSNVVPYTFVGPRRMLLTEQASLDRSLALTSMTRFHLADVVGAAASAVGRGRHLAHDSRVVQRADLESLRITAIGSAAGETFPWQVDGEYLGRAETLDVGYEPDALRVVLPPG